jgi:hypothetical protein
MSWISSSDIDRYRYDAAASVVIGHWHFQRRLPAKREKLIKVGAKVVSHGRYIAFQMAEVAIPRNVFSDILRLIAELRPLPVTSTA